MYVDSKYVSVHGDKCEIRRPFKDLLRCEVVHHHTSGCSDSSRACFLDQASRVLVCTDKGLKGGGVGKSKSAPRVKRGEYWTTPDQVWAVERLEQAMAHASPVLAYQCSDILFECDDPALMFRTISILTNSFKVSDRVWAWSGTQGKFARIHCARLLRVAAARVMLGAQLDGNNEPVIMGQDQSNYCQILESCVRRLMEQAKARRDVVLQAELRASWAVISSLTNPRDIRDWIRDYGPIVAQLGTLFMPWRNIGLTAQAIVSNSVLVYDLIQKKRDRSLSRQVMFITSLDISVTEVTMDLIQIVRECIQNCKRWVTAVLCASLLKKWLANPEKLSPECYAGCIDLLKLLCSFQVFVFRSNWKVRSGTLWTVAALHETSKHSPVRSSLAAIIQDRKTIEKDAAVIAVMDDMNSFRSAQLHLETTEVYGSVLEKELADLRGFVEYSRKHINTEQSEIDSKNYQDIIRKEIEKVMSTYENLSSQNAEVLAEMRETKKIICELRAMVASQTELIKLIKQPTRSSEKVDNLPRLSLLDSSFRGRVGILSRLRSNLGDTDEPRTLALVGFEGMGKSWLAVKFAQVNLDQYDIVVYLQADSASSILLGMLNVAKDLNCERCSDSMTVSAVKQVLSERKRVLLIYDNADFKPQTKENETESMEEYRRLLLLRIRGHVLLTSRVSRWVEQERFEVPEFEEKDAMELLRQGNERWKDTEARLVARELDCVPLAVNQTSSLLKRRNLTADEFLTDFREKRNPENTVSDTVLDMALNSLTEEGKQLMEMVALLSGFIPLEIVRGLRSSITDTCLMSVLSDVRAAGLIDLNQYGLIVNRSFQELAKKRCAEKESRQTAVSNTLNSMGSEAYSNDNLHCSGAYVTGKQRTCPEDPKIAKGVADRMVDFELAEEEMRLRSIQQTDASEVEEESPETRVVAHLDSGSSYFRRDKIPEAEREFREAERTAGDNLALQVKVKATYGSLLYRLMNYTQAAQELSAGVQLIQRVSDVPYQTLAELYTYSALVAMELKRDTEALHYYQQAFALRSNENPVFEKELVMVTVNFAYFYLTSTLKDLDEAEKLNCLAIKQITDQKNRQLGVIFLNMSIIYGERAKRCVQQEGGANLLELLEMKDHYHYRHLEFRKQYHNTGAVDQETAMIYQGLASSNFSRKEWTSALHNLELAQKKADPSQTTFINKIKKQIEAVNFNISNPREF